MPAGDFGLIRNPNNRHTFIIFTSQMFLFCEYFQIYFKWATLSNYPPRGCLEDPLFCVWVGCQTFSVSRFKISTHQLACSTRIENVPKMVRNRAIVWASINLNLVKVSDWIFGEEVMWIKAVKEEKMDDKKVVWQVLHCHQPTPHFSGVKCDQWCWGRGNQTESQNQTFQIDISFINTFSQFNSCTCMAIFTQSLAEFTV